MYNFCTVQFLYSSTKFIQLTNLQSCKILNCNNFYTTNKFDKLTSWRVKSLNIFKPPFNINQPALLAAAAATKDVAWQKKEINHINKWRKIMFKKFEEMKIETNEGVANFLLINFDKLKVNSSKVFKELAKSGILVRKMNIYGIKNSLRITIGNSYENKKFITIIGKILNV